MTVVVKLKVVLFERVTPFVNNLLKTLAVCVLIEGRVVCLSSGQGVGHDVTTALVATRTVLYFLIPLKLIM